MRTTWLLAPLLVLSTSLAQTPTIKTSVDLTEVPVVIQRSGKHVGGLKKENFVVLQDGKPQTIASFEEIHIAAPGTKQTLTSTSAPNENTPAQRTQQPITIIALDLINTPNLDRAYFDNEFTKYLSGTKALTGLVGLVGIDRSGIRLLHGLTEDPKSILAAIQRQGTVQPAKNTETDPLTHQMSDSGAVTMFDDIAELVSHLRAADESMSRFQDHAAKIDTLLAIQQLAQALKGIPGRKTLVLVGSGFKVIDTIVKPFMVNSPTGGKVASGFAYSADNMGTSLDQASYTWKLLNDANVAVYPIDTRRTVNTAYQEMDTSRSDAPKDLSYEQTRQADRDLIDGFKAIAAETGGKPCFYRTDLANCVGEAVDDDHDYYLIGFYADKNNSAPGWHKITVTSTEDRVSLRYRQGFMIAQFNAEQTRLNDLQLALNSPVAYTALQFRPQFTSFPDKNGRKSTEFALSIPPGAISIDEQTASINFDVAAIVRTDGGKEAVRFAQRIQRSKLQPENIADIKSIGINYTNKFELLPGPYAVWFVVRDNLSGRTGSMIMPVTVPK